MKFIAIFWFSGFFADLCVFPKVKCFFFPFVDSLVSVSSTRGCEKFPFLYETRKKRRVECCCMCCLAEFPPLFGFLFFCRFLFRNRCCSVCVCVCRRRTKICFPPNHIAYFLVHSRANSPYFSRSVLNILAISGTSGSSGFGSHSKEQMESNTLEMVSAGDHCDLRISRQMLPLELMFG